MTRHDKRPLLASTIRQNDCRGLRIGLMGGSFNPAHEGHCLIASLALKRLRLDRIWWLVSPQNPLKPTQGMAPLPERLASARQIARHPKIDVTTLESDLSTVYTADTVRMLRKRFPRVRFVWIMGADNLLQISSWRSWPSIFRRVNVAVFDRPSYSLKALSSRAAGRFARFRLPEHRGRAVTRLRPPAWVFLHTMQDPVSATKLRARIVEPEERNRPPDDRSELALSKALVAAVTASLDDDKADEVAVIDLAGKSTIGDYMVIASGRSTRQVSAMAERLIARLKRHGTSRVRVEGLRQGDWVLIDAGDVIVHLFRPEVRDFYGLEKMWGINARAADTGARPTSPDLDPTQTAPV